MATCNKDCFSCKYEDCICDDLDYEDYALGCWLDNAVLREQKLAGRRILSDEERRTRRNRKSDLWKKREKEKEKAKYTNVYAYGNENVLEYWKEWRRRKLGGGV